jgi:hypothetical protein
VGKSSALVIALGSATALAACAGESDDGDVVSSGTTATHQTSTEAPEDDANGDSADSGSVDLSCLEYRPGSEGVRGWSAEQETECAAASTVESCHANPQCSPVLGTPVACHDDTPCAEGSGESMFLGCVPQLICSGMGIYCLLEDDGAIKPYSFAGMGCDPPREYGLCDLTGSNALPTPVPPCP